MKTTWKPFEETTRWGRIRAIKVWPVTDDDDDIFPNVRHLSRNYYSNNRTCEVYRSILEHWYAVPFHYYYSRHQQVPPVPIADARHMFIGTIQLHVIETKGKARQRLRVQGLWCWHQGAPKIVYFHCLLPLPFQSQRTRDALSINTVKSDTNTVISHHILRIYLVLFLAVFNPLKAELNPICHLLV